MTLDRGTAATSCVVQHILIGGFGVVILAGVVTLTGVVILAGVVISAGVILAELARQSMCDTGRHVARQR